MRPMSQARAFLNLRLIVPACLVLSIPAWAEDIGRPLGGRSILVDPVTGRYLFMPGLPIEPMVAGRTKSTIAVVDSGVAKDHPQLAGRVVQELDFTGEGLADEYGHGTVVTLLALKNSLELQKRLPDMPKSESVYVNVKVIDRSGKVTKAAFLKALAWVAEHDVEVVNLSLGFKGTFQEHKDICAKIEENRKAIFIAAAGNDGPDALYFPAACPSPNVMSVGMVDPDGRANPNSGKGQIYAPGTTMLVSESQILLEEGKALARAGQYELALLHLDRSLAVDPLPETHYQKGTILLHQRKLPEAEVAFRQALDLTRAFPEALEHLAVTRYLQNDIEKAKVLLLEAIDLAPDRVSAHLNLALVLMDAMAYDESLVELDIVATLQPRHPKLKATRDEVRRRMKLP